VPFVASSGARGVIRKKHQVGFAHTERVSEFIYLLFLCLLPLPEFNPARFENDCTIAVSPFFKSGGAIAESPEQERWLASICLHLVAI